MNVVVSTPTGHIGKVLVEELFNASVKVTVIHRHPQKVEALERLGARVVCGSLDDASVVTEACHGADALFWLNPPDYTAPDLREHYNRLGRAATAAIRATGIPRVVHLSSVGSQHDSGVGPVKGLFDVEQLLNAATENVTHLRPGFFMENYLFQLESMKTASSIFMPVNGTTPAAMIATRDIGRAAARVILDGSWSGRRCVGLHGPADLTFDEAAEALSRGTGKKITHVCVPPEAARSALLAAGMSADCVAQFLEMYDGFNRGRMQPAEPRTKETTTPTTLESFAHAVIKPLLG